MTGPYEPRIPCPSASWERYHREQEAQEEAEAFIGPVQMFTCPRHPGVWYYSGPCDSCYAEDVAETDRLIADARARGEM